jgi:hypothetical protein
MGPALLSFDSINFVGATNKFSRLLATGGLAELMKAMYQFDGPAI